jgi:acetyl esterase
MHGGGWVLGDLETHDALCHKLCAGSAAIVASVDYRRSPEHAYPAPLDDCLEATRYLYEHSSQYSIDARRIIVAGDSAGGNLAAAVALKCRDQAQTDGGMRLAAQVLIYPVLDADFLSPSYREFAQGYGLTRNDMRWFWQQYTGRSAIDAYAAPLRSESLAGLPPTLMVTAECDVLRSEADAYARRLQTSGNQIEKKQYDGVIHGFVHFSAAIDKGDQALAFVADWIKSVSPVGVP